MSTISGNAAAVAVRPVEGRSRLVWSLLDAWVVCRRNLIQTWRVPELLVFSTIQPVMFVLLFVYVFGGAINVGPGVDYVDFLMPGIFIQTAIFGSMVTGVGLAEDRQRGLIDRFRSLPMSRGALLAGRTLSDLFRNVFVVAIMLLVGIAVGFRFGDTTVPAVLVGFALMLLFSYAFAWVSAVIGLSVRNAEAAQSAGFIWVFPLTFASSAFVPVSTMPGWLQAFAEHQPITVTIDATRALFLGGPVASALLQSLAWCVGMLVVFVPWCIRVYRRSTGG
ncbi:MULTISPECIES: ABC transporter permease [Protofrankia]|uniref:Transport permease protein n=1 Tax=Candidatus Protofrankia datiscae TaxID=2716812 RepID=F8AZ04_9ACTN|nr:MULTISPECIES: ABC transporter permease [Protofrankia]AEH09592.1 ABC-2 type transporter [Candidatus Protofrankia datiscae]